MNFEVIGQAVENAKIKVVGVGFVGNYGGSDCIFAQVCLYGLLYFEKFDTMAPHLNLLVSPSCKVDCAV